MATTVEDPVRATRVKIQRAIGIALAVTVVIIALAIAAVIYFVPSMQPRFIDAAFELFKPFVVLTFAGCTSFFIVTFLEQKETPVDVEGLGFKLKGAAGQILLWNIGMLVISGCYKFLVK